jgi:hypothetical protein
LEDIGTHIAQSAATCRSDAISSTRFPIAAVAIAIAYFGRETISIILPSSSSGATALARS